MTNNRENLGPAEKIIQSVLTYTDHLYHGRPGLVVPDARTNIGVRWEPVTHKVENDQKIVYRLGKAGKKKIETRVGVMRNIPVETAPVDGRRVVPLPLQIETVVFDGVKEVGEYREAGLFREVAVWMYRQVADVWKLDNEFAARWASFAFSQEQRDLKIVLAAFMLVQSRKGDPVREGDQVLFKDDDYRDIGEAMMLLRRKDAKDLNPKQLFRMYELLTLPEIAAINRELGFGLSPRNPYLGRWPTAVEKWLRHREENPKLLEGLVRAGFKSTVLRLVRGARYKPMSAKFFKTLGWRQSQAADGRRTLAIGDVMDKAASLEGKTEAEICQFIITERPNWKRLVGLLPKEISVTRAIVAAAIEAGAMSDSDLVIATPTLEELGLLTEVADIRARWEKAVRNAEDTRAANIAKNVRNKDLKDKLVEAADTAVKKAVEEVVKNVRVYGFVDTSGSMQQSIEQAKTYLAQFLQGFPLDQLHVATFTTTGREVTIKHASAAGVAQAFAGITAGGGTAHGSGVRALAKHAPKADEDVLCIWIGDEAESNRGTFEADVIASGLRPTAFGLIKVPGSENGNSVTATAAKLGIPCFMIDERTFADAYAIPRTIRALIAATPVGHAAKAAVPRLTLVDQIMKTDLLTKPVWA